MIDALEAREARRLTLGGRTFVVAPVWKQIKRITPKLFAIQIRLGREIAQATEEDFDAAMDVVWLAIQRCHPDVSREDLDDLPVSVLDLPPALALIAEATGLVVGKAPAPEPTTEPTSTT